MEKDTRQGSAGPHSAALLRTAGASGRWLCSVVGPFVAASTSLGTYPGCHIVLHDLPYPVNAAPAATLAAALNLALASFMAAALYRLVAARKPVSHTFSAPIRPFETDAVLHGSAESEVARRRLANAIRAVHPELKAG
jgi:hypothetical protein